MTAILVFAVRVVGDLGDDAIVDAVHLDAVPVDWRLHALQELLPLLLGPEGFGVLKVEAVGMIKLFSILPERFDEGSWSALFWPRTRSTPPSRLLDCHVYG